jgi:hypothetical protein
MRPTQKETFQLTIAGKSDLEAPSWTATMPECLADSNSA